MSLTGRRLAAVALAVLLAAAATTAQAAPSARSTGSVSARTAAVDGNDYSWPQCPKGIGNGQGQPLPSGHHLFAIVGLTNGAGLHENPCLASEWDYARAHADHVTGYTVPTYPGRQQRIAAKTGHYGRCFHLHCRLRNSGWAQGQFAAASLHSVRAHPPMVWVDVETRYRHPWTGHPSRNRLVVKALIASLEHAGFHAGIYSTNYMWHHIVNYETRLPEWVPAGSTSRGCFLPISHGPVWLSQFGHYYKKRHEAYDENGVCRRAPALHRMFERA